MTTSRLPRDHVRAAALGLVLLLIVPCLAPSRAPPASGGEPPAAPEGPLALLERSLSREAVATARFLEHLGYRFEWDDAVSSITPSAVGDPRVRFPRNATAEQVAAFGKTLAAVADSLPARLAYQERLHDAAQRALKRLADNATSGNYTFTKFLVFDTLWFTMSPPEPEWVKKGEVYQPRASPSAAIEAFYAKKAAAECYVAQLVATYAMQYELYGKEAFDDTFRPEELAIGAPADYHKSEFGRHMMGAPSDHPWLALLIGREDREVDPGLVLARYGPKAFTGLTGIVRDLDGTDISNENFVIASVSQAALDVLKARGGFRFLAEQTLAANEAHETARRLFATGVVVRECQKKMEEILSGPVFEQIQVYVHPYGVVTLRKIVEDKIRRDLNAVEVGPYLHGREDAFFRRYRESFECRWLAAHPAVPPVPR